MEIRSSTERWRSRILMATCCILALTAGIDAAVDRKRMDRDLDIMEAVLARLLNENGSSRELHDAIVQGIYFTGYGALFLVEGSGSWGAIPHRLRVISEGGHGKVDYTMGAAPRPADDEEDAKKNRMDGYRAPLIEFLGTYADAIGQLEPGDRVTVLIKPGGHGLHALSVGPKLPALYRQPGLADLYKMPLVADILRDLDIDVDSIAAMVKVQIDSSMDEQDEHAQEIHEALGEAREAVEEARSSSREARREVRRMRVEVRKAREKGRKAGHAARAAVLAFRRGSEAQPDLMLEATVRKRDIEAFGKGRLDAKAFEGKVTFKERKREDTMPKKVDVLASILDRSLEQDGHRLLMYESKATGIYQEGLGVIYFVRPRSSYVRYFDASADENEEGKVVRQRLVADITEVLADYGHTLKLLKPTESIICQVDLSSRSPGESGRLTVRAPMKAIDQYRKDKIDLATFRKRVEILD